MNKKILSISIVGLIILLLGVFYFFARPGVPAFAASYETYERAATQNDAAAYYPSTQDNEARQELNAILSQVLTGADSPDERVQSARRGLALVEEIEVQIDAMGVFALPVTDAIRELESARGILPTSHTYTITNAIVELAKKRVSLIEDIRGLSYRANFHTETILKRIIEDGGEVTPEHARLLNEQIPLVEEQFDERSNLYSALEEVRVDIERLADSL